MILILDSQRTEMLKGLLGGFTKQEKIKREVKKCARKRNGKRKNGKKRNGKRKNGKIKCAHKGFYDFSLPKRSMQ